MSPAEKNRRAYEYTKRTGKPHIYQKAYLSRAARGSGRWYVAAHPGTKVTSAAWAFAYRMTWWEAA